jgi:hypothetical protein
MPSKKRIDPNQPKHWHECAEHFDHESDNDDDNIINDSEDPEMPYNLQESSDESEDDAAIEKDSGDESDTSYVETDSISDEEPPRRRAKREKQSERSEVKIYTARSGRQWTTEEPPK